VVVKFSQRVMRCGFGADAGEDTFCARPSDDAARMMAVLRSNRFTLFLTPPVILRFRIPDFRFQILRPCRVRISQTL